jgi:transposase
VIRGERAAFFYILIRTTTLNCVEPEAYVRRVIARIGAHPVNRLDELLPCGLDDA